MAGRLNFNTFTGCEDCSRREPRQRPMMTIIFVTISLVPGYAAAVVLFMGVVFGVTSLKPGFVAKDFRIRKRYKVVEIVVWPLCSAVAGYLTAAIAGVSFAWIAVPVLAVTMIVVLWMNTWEMRQRGFIPQTLMSIGSIAGVAAGYFLRFR
jgi:hypothetical protein